MVVEFDQLLSFKTAWHRLNFKSNISYITSKFETHLTKQPVTSKGTCNLIKNALGRVDWYEELGTLAFGADHQCHEKLSRCKVQTVITREPVTN